MKYLNPDVDVPWQRVIGSSGKISSRGPGTEGAERQRDALVAEGVNVAATRDGEFKVNWAECGWFPDRIQIGAEGEAEGNEEHEEDMLRKMESRLRRLKSRTKRIDSINEGEDRRPGYWILSTHKLSKWQNAGALVAVDCRLCFPTIGGLTAYQDLEPVFHLVHITHFCLRLCS